MVRSPVAASTIEGEEEDKEREEVHQLSLILCI